MVGSNHPLSQTKSLSQVSGSDIYSDFQRSVLPGKVFFTRLPEVLIDLFQGEAIQPIEPAELHYLYDNIAGWTKKELGVYAALVTGAGENKTEMPGIRKDLASIITSFSPVSKERDKIDASLTAEIDLLIATDCISEGQNLQDCDYLINYDIHWNPVRIIRRFGRVDRLGSKNDKI